MVLIGKRQHLKFPALYRLVVAGLTMGLAGTSSGAMLLGDSANGKTIHDEKCLGCHSAQFKDPAQVYLRSPRRVNTIEGLMKQVPFCSKQTGANLNEQEIDDVIKYLNETYYKFKQ